VFQRPQQPAVKRKASVVRVQDGRPAAEGFRHVAVAETEADPLSLGRHLGMTLTACLDVFTHHYLQARNQLPVVWDGAAHQRLRELCLSQPSVG
jgi:hypothetical protein